MVRDGPKLLDDVEEVGDFTPGYEISILLDRILVMWSIVFCALTLTCWPSVQKERKKKEVAGRVSHD